MASTIPYPKNEEARLDALNSYRVLDTANEASYDHIVTLAASICKTPISVISLIDTNRQWFKARIGIEASEAPREVAFCSYTVCDNKPLIVENAATDPIFKDHPLVVTDPSIRFYAGIPLLTSEGHALGSLCVVDVVPRKLGADELSSLEKLAQQVVSLLELRKSGFLLRGSSERVNELEQFFSMSVDAFATVDFDGCFRMVNSAFCRMLGYKEAEIVLKHYSHFVHPEDLATTEAVVAGAISGRVVQDYENRYITKDSQVIYLSWKALPNTDQRVLYAVGRNVTEAKLTEKLVEEQKAKILSASKLASLGEMAGGVAHEINTPLNAIIFCAEQIQETATELGDEGLLEMGNLVSETAQRISKIVKGLKAFARDGAQEDLEAADVQQVVDDALSLGSERIRQAGVKLQFEKSHEAIIAPCRQVQLGQVILNLLNNAFDAVVGKPDAWVKVCVVESDRAVKIEVTDSGMGLTAEVKDKLFQPFFTTKGVGKGTGIGLSISKGIVESHRGSLYVDETCRNTKFVIELPKAASSVDVKKASMVGAA